VSQGSSDWEEQTAEHHARLQELRDRGEPHFVLWVHMLGTGEGGRRGPAFSNWRPQLWIGQRLANGRKLFWDSVWFIHDRSLAPGATGDVTMFLPAHLPAAVLSKNEHLEFYEGTRLVATAEVTLVYAPGHPQHEPYGAELRPHISPVLPRRRRILGSGRRVNGRRSRSRATARRAAIDAVAASWTLEAEEDGLRPHPALRDV
jgi:hypothetical protein